MELKFNKKEVIEILKTFSVNFAVGSLVLGLFQNIFVANIVAVTFLLSAIALCLHKKGE